MRLNNIFHFTVFMLVIGSSCSAPQEANSKQATLESIAHEIINSAQTCTLISLDSTGHPRARVMDPFPPNDEFEIWFGTNSVSRKVKEIATNPKVTVHYYDKPSAAYVSIYGQATIVDDPALKSKYWKKAWEDFYPKYPNGYSLIRVIPQRIEVISEKHGVTGDSLTWKPATLILP